MSAPVKVFWWPFTALAAPDGVVVIGIEGDGDRPRARVRIREAIHDALLLLTGEAVTLHGESGEAAWALRANARRIGLSISHDIIVKQYSGMIEVDTKAGEFTEFRITLPRNAASFEKPGALP